MNRFSLQGKVPDVLGYLGDLWARTPIIARYVVYAAMIVFAFALPNLAVGDFMTPESKWSTVLFYPISIYVLMAIGLNVVVGQAGLLDLGYVAFFAVGGYTLAKTAISLEWNFWIILPMAIVLAALSGLLLGAPTLRLRGDYLAIVTLGFGEIIRITANNLEFTGGAAGLSPIPHPPGAQDVWWLNYDNILDARPYYYLVLVLIILAVIFIKRLERSRVGRAWIAIREDEDAAEVMGVPTFKYKLAAFAIGASFGGTAGAVYASQTISITSNNFEFLLSVTILCAVVLGGSGNLPGVILGAFLVAWLPERFRGFAEYRILIFGAALVLMMAIRPEGLLPSRRRRAELAERSDVQIGAEPEAAVEADR